MTKKISKTDLTFFEKVWQKVKDNKIKWFVGLGAIAVYFILKKFGIDVPDEIFVFIFG